MNPDGRLEYLLSGDFPWEPQLTPGANLAKQRGCTCSRLDNHWGEGVWVRNGTEAWLEWIVTPGCPLHGGFRPDDNKN